MRGAATRPPAKPSKGSSGKNKGRHAYSCRPHQQKEEARQAAASERYAAGYARVRGALLARLARDVGDHSGEVADWEVIFDLERVSGDPEGVARGHRLNMRDKSIKYVSPDGQVFKTREAVVQHFVPTDSNEAEEEEEEKEEAVVAPVKEPPPVEIDGGELAFEVERIIDERTDKKGRREFLVRWVGYSAEDDSWEPEAGFLDREPIDLYESRRTSLLPRDDFVWRRVQSVGDSHQATIPCFQGPLPPGRASRGRGGCPRTSRRSWPG